MTEVSLSPKITASVKFPATLWDMINKCKSSAISWGRFGTCVKINKGAFEKEYLTSGEKFSSFIRQLNMYGFRKLKNQIKYVGMPPEFCNDEVEYEHPLFVKCHPELLPYVRRKATKRNDKNRSARRNYQTETSPRVSEDNTVCTKLVSDMANRNEEDNRENKQSQVDNVEQEFLDQCFRRSISQVQNVSVLKSNKKG
ncbi:heat shock transcription factor, Y-linked-like isoform X2 [Gigantopelta aegis]|uniref:heat shock transcription factor, Y-linked-like isoform X2 n=1 Tax=Gigantopelta aegis TaxID=1735272 RepID=UPI001B8886B2|nr:heat shock transcription factor, Y-linked-like isoform X2 [Gigantopelta aegis]